MLFLYIFPTRAIENLTQFDTFADMSRLKEALQSYQNRRKQKEERSASLSEADTSNRQRELKRDLEQSARDLETARRSINDLLLQLDEAGIGIEVTEVGSGENGITFTMKHGLKGMGDEIDKNEGCLSILLGLSGGGFEDYFVPFGKYWSEKNLPNSESEETNGINGITWQVKIEPTRKGIEGGWNTYLRFVLHAAARGSLHTLHEGKPLRYEGYLAFRGDFSTVFHISDLDSVKRKLEKFLTRAINGA